MDYSNGLFDCQSPTSPFLGSLRALHLLEDLRAALEMMDQDEREGLRCQVPDTTADGLVEWLQQGQLVSNSPCSLTVANAVNVSQQQQKNSPSWASLLAIRVLDN